MKDAWFVVRGAWSCQMQIPGEIIIVAENEVELYSFA